jgi:hypothetical protein
LTVRTISRFQRSARQPDFLMLAQHPARPFSVDKRQNPIARKRRASTRASKLIDEFLTMMNSNNEIRVTRRFEREHKIPGISSWWEL